MRPIIKEDALIATTVSPNTKKYYENLGHNCKKGDIIYVKPTELKDNSSVIETRVCDICNREYEKTHQAHVKCYNSFGFDVCPECCGTDEMKSIIQSHREETNRKRYGENVPVKNKSVKQKMFATNLTKYGVKSTLLDENTKEKIKATNLQKYGVENPVVLPEIREKIENTNIQKYGSKYPTQNEEVKRKIESTNILKYGVKSTAQIPEIREKMNASLVSNGLVPTSQPQIELKDMIMKIYPDAEVILNREYSHIIMDIYFKKDNIEIDVEYDGWYWHKDKQVGDLKRDKFVQSNNIKVLRILSGSLLPTEEELKNSIELLLNSDKKFTKITLKDWKE